MDMSKVYTVLYRVVNKGFDMAGVSVGGDPYVLKTTSPSETDLARVQSFGGGAQLFRVLRLAYSVYMVDGTSFLDDREKGIPLLTKRLLSLPWEDFQILEECSLRLQMRYRRYLRFVGGFSLSPSARNLWKIRRSLPCGYSLGEDTECAVAWALTNSLLDEEEDREYLMSGAIYTASAYNPKGVKKSVQGMDNLRKTREEERKALIKYGSLTNKRMAEKASLETREKWVADLSTAQDLVDELHRQMNGVKDKHDLFMEEYSDRIRREREAARKENEERLSRLRESRKDLPDFTGSYVLTEEEISRVRKGEVSLAGLAREKSLRIFNEAKGI